MKKLIILFVSIFCFTGILSAQGKVYVIDISDLTEAERLAVVSFQGLANREKPQVFVRTKGTNMFGRGWRNWWNNRGTGAVPHETFEKYPFSEDVFIDYYAKTFGFEFQDVTFEEALVSLKSVVKGVVVYTNTPSMAPAGVSVALTAAGVEEAIPVTQAVMNKFPKLKELSVIKNFHSMYFDDKYMAYDYLIDNYADKVSKEWLHSYNLGNNCDYSADYAIYNKMFTSDLSFASKVGVSVSPGKFPYNQKDTEKLDKICNAVGYEPASYIWGWAEPDEGVLIFRAGELGMVVICTVQSNASFHAAVKVPESSFKQKRQITEENVTLENKVYIAFESNEGDTYKCLGGVMNEGTWLQSKRGNIKMNWGINPLVLQKMPGLAKYYYDSMTDNDYFFNATAGIGYVNAGTMTDEEREVMALKNKQTSEYCDTHHIDIWWYRDDAWVAKMGLKGKQSWETRQSVVYPRVAGQVPIINYDIAYDLTSEGVVKKRPENLATYLAAMGNNPTVAKGPWFEIVYAMDPEMAHQTMEILEQQYPGRFEAVCLDELFILAEKARSQVEGKTVNRDTKLWDQLIADNEAYFSFIDFNFDFDSPCGLADKNLPRNLNVDVENGNLVLIKKDSKTNWGMCILDLNYDFGKYPYLSLRLPKDVKNAPFFLKLAEKELRLETASRSKADPQIYTWDLQKVLGKTGFEKNTSLQIHLATSTPGDKVVIDYIKSSSSDPASVSTIHIPSFSVNVNNKEVIIKAKEELSYRIYNALGNICVETSRTVINMNNYPGGTYIIKSSNGETLKFILK